MVDRCQYYKQLVPVVPNMVKMDEHAGFRRFFCTFLAKVKLVLASQAETHQLKPAKNQPGQ